MYQQNRIETEPSPQRLLELSLRAVVTQASRQKLLPKIMWRADKEFGSKKLLEYQKSVHKQYDDDLKAPSKYDPEAAKSEREKFRDKVIKLVNNQLEVDYFDNVRMKDRTVIAYQGHQLEQQKVETKKQFEIFKNFNEKKFKETYANLFDDKLELGINGLYHNRAKKRCHTLHLIESKPKKQMKFLKTEESQPRARIRPIDTSYTAPKSERKKDFILDVGKKKAALVHFNEKKAVGKEISRVQENDISKIMRQIGGYSSILREQGLTLTKESINRWLKTLYEKPARIIDFLEIKRVTDFNQFWNISKRLRVMPQEHILFMTFLYYDGNNDGYICDYDLQRIASLSLKRSVLVHDHKKIRQSNIKKMLTKRAAYLELYKRHEVTETAYFEWKIHHQQGIPASIEQQMKNRMLTSKQKHIFLDFSAFCSIFKFDKPFLWYDLMHIFGGVTFQGLRYE